MAANPARPSLLGIVLLVSLAAVLALGGWVSRRSPVAIARGASAALPPAAAGLTAAPTPASPEAASPDLPPVDGPGGGETARSFLAAYYGDRWPETARAIEGTGLDLDQPYVFTPWEEVEGRFAATFGLDTESERASAAWAVRYWPDQLDANWLAQHFGVDTGSIGPDDLAAIEALAVDHNRLLDENAQDWVSGIEAHLAERWESGEYFRAPFTTMGLYDERGFYSTSTAGYGWAVAVVLKRDEYPDLAAIEQHARELRDERDDLIARYLFEGR